MSETVITADAAKKLLGRARKAGELSTEPLTGWSTIFSGPEKILAIFKPLKLKSEFMLTGYRFQEGGNGNGFLYAVPKGTELAAADECPVDPTHS